MENGKRLSCMDTGWCPLSYKLVYKPINYSYICHNQQLWDL